MVCLYNATAFHILAYGFVEFARHIPVCTFCSIKGVQLMMRGGYSHLLICFQSLTVTTAQRTTEVFLVDLHALAFLVDRNRKCSLCTITVPEPCSAS